MGRLGKFESVMDCTHAALLDQYSVVPTMSIEILSWGEVECIDTCDQVTEGLQKAKLENCAALLVQ